MRLVDVEVLKSIMDKGDIVIGEDILDCETPHEWLVYLLAKVELFLNESIDNLPSIEVVRCKECKHWGTGVAGETEYVKCCDYGKYMVGENGYCVYGEEKKNEVN